MQIKIAGQKVRFMVVFSKGDSIMQRIKTKRLGVGRHLEGLDVDEMIKEREGTDSAIDEKLDLGEKFETDKKAIEEKIDEVEASDLPAKEKRQQLQILKEELEKLKKAYEEKVSELAEELLEKGQEEVDQMTESIEKLTEQEDSLREVKSESGEMDLSGAADAASERKKQFEKNKEEAIRNLDLKIQQLQIQQRNMRTNRLRKGK